MAKIKDLFVSKRQELLGIDVSSSAVKLLEITVDNDQFILESYGVETFPEKSSVEKNIPHSQIVGEAIQKAILKSGTRLNYAAVAIADSKIIRKTIKMPASLSEDELESQLHFEADQFISFPLEDISLDFEIQDIDPRNPEFVDVLLVACRSVDVDRCTLAVEMGGLKCKVVEVESNALESAMNLVVNQLPDAGFGKLVAVVDVGATKTKLSILNDMKVVYTREHAFGGQALTKKIQVFFGLSFEEAESAKRQGGLPRTYHTEVLEPFKQALVSQIICAIQLFFSTRSHNALDQIVLTGGCSLIDKLDQLIEDEFEVPTCVANLFSALPISPAINAEKLSEDAPSLMLACGLALSGLERSYP